MTDRLLATVRRYADFHADRFGVARTPVPGLTLIRATSPSTIDYAITRPLVALILQGAKRVTTGLNTQTLCAGQSMLISADIPTASEITSATVAAPYYSLVFDLDRTVIRDLALEMAPMQDADGQALHIDHTEPEVADAMRRLMEMLERPASVTVLQTQLIREAHYWLLAGRHGVAILELGLVDSHAERIGRAIGVLRAEFDRTIAMERLATVSGMGLASFYHHFRTVTSLSPLQFQKQLRLVEARRLLVSERMPASRVAYEVGYESVSHFSREYSRMFGTSPSRDAREAKGRIEAAA